MSSQPFFAMMHTYPWDLTDEGLETALDKLRDIAGCEEVMVTPCYHQSTYFLPHNPKRPVYYGDDGAIYFRPNLERYRNTSIRPFVSDIASTPDYFETIVESIKKRKMNFGAWIVYTFQTNLSKQYPHFARHDVFGIPHRGALSMAPNDVQEYFLALTIDIMERFNPNTVIVESLMRRGFSVPTKRRAEMALRHQFLLGLDFNPEAVSNANSAGMDGNAFQQEVANWLRPRLAQNPTTEDEMPVTAEWLANAFEGRLETYIGICQRNTTEQWIRIADLIRKSGAKLQTNLATKDTAIRNDLDTKINHRIDRVPARILNTSSETKQSIVQLLDQVATGGIAIADLGPNKLTDPGLLAEQTQEARISGAAGAMFYNYGLLRDEELAHIGAALRSTS